MEDSLLDHERGRGAQADDAAMRTHLVELLTASAEVLDAELAEHLVSGPIGPAIKHPLVVAPVYGPQLNALYNEQLRAKRAALAAALEAGDIAQVVWLHERPWRAETLAAHAHLLGDVDYWQLLARVWIDSENIVEMADLWDALLRDDRTGRESMMTEEERAALAALPSTVEIFQGHTDRRDDGWSWTTDRPVAVWFANRFAQLEGGHARISTARVRRETVVAYLLSRGEAEVLVPPECVEGRTVTAMRG